MLAGTLEALVTGQADLALGLGMNRELPSGLAMKELGSICFDFAVAPHHPLASATEPIDDAEIVRHRAVAVADSAHRLTPVTVNLLPGQEVLTVSDMQAKIAALLRGIGCGFVPEPMVRDAIAAGTLKVKTVQRARAPAHFAYAWRAPLGKGGKMQPGLGLKWWLERLDGATTRRALLERYGAEPVGAAR